MNDDGLRGKTAVITGAARGIGAAISRSLGRRGVRVVLLDQIADQAEAMAHTLESEGIEAMGGYVDVRKREDVIRALDKAVGRFGAIDIAVNNAAVGPLAPFMQLTDAQWAASMDTNLTGTFVVSQEAVRRMPRHAGGRIINIASLAAHTANSSQAAYASAKAGVCALTRAMAFELAPEGITANAVSPGTIETELSRGMLTPEAREARERRIPLGRLGQVEEVSELVVFLASAYSSYITGQVVIVDGGLLMGGVRAPMGNPPLG